MGNEKKKTSLPPLESHEVVGQRVRHLAQYFEESLPMFFGGESEVKVSRNALIMMLTELDEEMGYSVAHRVQVCTNICDRITSVLGPQVISAQNAASIKFADAGQDVDFEDIYFEVQWSTLLPDLQGDLGQLLRIGQQIAVCYLNDVLTMDTSWGTVGDELLTNLEDVIEFVLGAVGFTLLFIYIQVVEKSTVPYVKCYAV